ncbi:unnamed protein product, partial [Polarella glacialis]
MGRAITTTALMNLKAKAMGINNNSNNMSLVSRGVRQAMSTLGDQQQQQQHHKQQQQFNNSSKRRPRQNPRATRYMS